jgi:hypothetical protein
MAFGPVLLEGKHLKSEICSFRCILLMLAYFQKRGPQRSVDCIVSAAFIITLCLVSFLCMELLKVCRNTRTN